MAQGDVGDLVGEHRRDLRTVGGEAEQTAGDIEPAARQGERVDHGRVEERDRVGLLWVVADTDEPVGDLGEQPVGCGRAVLAAEGGHELGMVRLVPGPGAAGGLGRLLRHLDDGGREHAAGLVAGTGCEHSRERECAESRAGAREPLPVAPIRAPPTRLVLPIPRHAVLAPQRPLPLDDLDVLRAGKVDDRSSPGFDHAADPDEAAP